MEAEGGGDAQNTGQETQGDHGEIEGKKVIGYM